MQGIEAAYQSARLAKAPFARRQRLLDLGTALAAQDYSKPARLAFQAVIAPGSGIFGDQAHVALMQLATAAGDRLAFERHRSAVSEISRWPVGMAVDYQFQLGLGLARFRQFTRARAAWTDALALAREYDLTEWCLRLEERLEQDPVEVQADGPIVAPEEAFAVIAEVTTWLRCRPRKRPSET